MRRFLLIISLVALGGCASTQQASVHFVNGKAFWAGDSQCIRGNTLPDPNKIACADASGRLTGEQRQALSDQELRYITSQQQIASQNEALQMQQLNQTIQQNNANLRNTQYSTIVPQPAPLNSYGASQVRCINAGIYTNCRAY